VITFNLILSLTLLFALAAAAFDLRSGHIPNGLTFAGIALGAVLQVTFLVSAGKPPGEGLDAALLALAVVRTGFAVLACGLVPYLLFLRSGMGGGDVKLLAAIGAFLGPVLGLEVELYAFLGMALFASAWLAYRGRLLQVLGTSAALLVNPMLPKERRRAVAPELFSSFRFGPAVLVAVAAVALLRWSPMR
jgi:prepilin peptidase CpaA